MEEASHKDSNLQERENPTQQRQQGPHTSEAEGRARIGSKHKFRDSKRGGGASRWSTKERLGNKREEGRGGRWVPQTTNGGTIYW